MALLMILVGVGLLFWLNKRAFYRRNQFGIEEHRSFSGMIGTKVLDTVGSVFAVILIIWGLIIML